VAFFIGLTARKFGVTTTGFSPEKRHLYDFLRVLCMVLGVQSSFRPIQAAEVTVERRTKAQPGRVDR
jgi:hypothetical protein